MSKRTNPNRTIVVARVVGLCCLIAAAASGDEAGRLVLGLLGALCFAGSLGVAINMASDTLLDARPVRDRSVRGAKRSQSSGRGMSSKL